jgi:hypothetical protein
VRGAIAEAHQRDASPAVLPRDQIAPAELDVVDLLLCEGNDHQLPFGEQVADQASIAERDPRPLRAASITRWA